MKCLEIFHKKPPNARKHGKQTLKRIRWWWKYKNTNRKMYSLVACVNQGVVVTSSTFSLFWWEFGNFIASWYKLHIFNFLRKLLCLYKIRSAHSVASKWKGMLVKINKIAYGIYWFGITLEYVCYLNTTKYKKLPDITI